MAGKKSADDLRAVLREFVSSHPQGWTHEDWVALLQDLVARGHSLPEDAEVGRLLERERLAAMLGRIEKVGPQRIKVITDHFGTLWNLRAADVDGLAESAKIPRALAERIKQAV